tara:strand:+ start:288 stop:830 length:543 start_codon:yes stop_codon:yes gene_type:complete
VSLYQISTTKKPVWYYRILRRGSPAYETRSTRTVDFARAKQIAEERFYKILTNEEDGVPVKYTRPAEKINMKRPRGKISNKQGVYTITNKYTGTVYVGISSNIPKRWQQHRGDLVRDKHKNKQLQRDWDKWGEWSFDWDLQFYAADTSREALEKIEQLKIKKIIKEGRLVYNTDVRLLIE